ncbi:nucleotidyltransferase family protein [Thiofilum flexile]|uniref:nucleotidyltransferase family protein n=1 Tax=Thiofilum flexile TaxID=125627 RepID=UPI000380C8C0|nr:nucleotidyltransferase family protein [Thiofilum flexile]
MQKISSQYPAILLAAGQSTRFGSQKLLHVLPNGVVMGVQSARHLKAVFERVIAVLSPEYVALQALLEQDTIEIVINQEAKQGMGTSLALGVLSAFEVKGWVIALGDMPFISLNTLQRVGQGLEQGAKMIAPFYQGQRGHPVGFSAAFRDKLITLQGDKGAGSIIQREQALLTQVEVEDKGVLWDIDTPGAVAELKLS